MNPSSQPHTLRLLLTGGLLLTGCRDPGTGGLEISVRDSAGIEIVESVPPAEEGSERWVIDSVPLFDIGADSSDPTQEFTRPGGQVRLAEGRIAVADARAQEIRFFDPNGIWLHNAGRRDSFPGPGDSLYAIEPGTGFVTVLDSAGRYGRWERPALPGPGRFAIFLGVFAGGDWLINGSEIIRPTQAGV